VKELAGSENGIKSPLNSRSESMMLPINAAIEKKEEGWGYYDFGS